MEPGPERPFDPLAVDEGGWSQLTQDKGNNSLRQIPQESSSFSFPYLINPRS